MAEMHFFFKQLKGIMDINVRHVKKDDCMALYLANSIAISCKYSCVRTSGSFIPGPTDA